MGSRELLLDIDPPELKFHFELKKQISCSLQLTNRSDDHVAFKVKTTSPKKYCVRPSAGIILPRSTPLFAQLQCKNSVKLLPTCNARTNFLSRVSSLAKSLLQTTSPRKCFSRSQGMWWMSRGCELSMYHHLNHPLWFLRSLRRALHLGLLYQIMEIYMLQNCLLQQEHMLKIFSKKNPLRIWH
ncbi:hypothetical protein OPV22_001235 [Ensete ventricosum]|uniref:MSP domain-containing protein n=1 Tax=Ensete ventricosum TaxID=4639 RepID=A0AAV8QBR1_ENSVE|nr:hypothetical protein OPV22_001235 [Ensete ventricosum]